MRRASMDRPFASARPLAEHRVQNFRTYSLTEADLQQKFATVSSLAHRRNEALFRTAHGDLGAAWMASKTSVSSLAMLQVCIDFSADIISAPARSATHSA